MQSKQLKVLCAERDQRKAQKNFDNAVSQLTAASAAVGQSLDYRPRPAVHPSGAPSVLKSSPKLLSQSARGRGARTGPYRLVPRQPLEPPKGFVRLNARSVQFENCKKLGMHRHVFRMM